QAAAPPNQADIKGSCAWDRAPARDRPEEARPVGPGGPLAQYRPRAACRPIARAAASGGRPGAAAPRRAPRRPGQSRPQALAYPRGGAVGGTVGSAMGLTRDPGLN